MHSKPQSKGKTLPPDPQRSPTGFLTLIHVFSKAAARHHVVYSSSSDLVSSHFLPLRLLAVDKWLQDAHNLLERGQPGLELLVELGRRSVLSDLLVEVGALRAVAHGGGEDLLDDEVVVGLESLTVGVGEGDGELLRGVLRVGAEGLGHEVETTEKERGSASGLSVIV